ncbi:MAG: hypothetical protein ACRDD2_00700, partial [Sarcina sp.]
SIRRCNRNKQKRFLKIEKERAYDMKKFNHQLLSSSNPNSKFQSKFPIPNSPFQIPHSPFPIPNSPFPIPFQIPHSPL